MPERVRSVAVVGRDAAAWIIALGLARALSRIDVAITIVELPSVLDRADVYATLPSLATLHTLLGLNERALYTRCVAVPSLGQQFVGWSPSRPPFVHGYDVARPAINDVDFVQFWSLARRRGLNVAYEDFSIAAVAARQGRIPDRKRDADAGGGIAPGYHLDAPSYAALLREGCVAAGLKVRGSASVRADFAGDQCRAVVLDDGTRVEADLFIDASGPERVVIGSCPGVEFDRWSSSSDHLVTGSLLPLDPAPAHSRIIATPEGWLGLFPLQDRTAIAGVVAGDAETKHDAAQRLAAAAGIRPGEALVVRPFDEGALRRSWLGNCIAVGNAAVAMAPLDAVELQLVQIALSNLVAFWPADRDCMIEAAEYDRAVASHVANIRDFQLAHYHLSERPEPFWLQARAAGMPERLAARLRLFEARGIVPAFEDETFLPQSWAAILIGHGLVPIDSDPAVERTPEDEQMRKFQRLLHVIAQQVPEMPSVTEYLRAMRDAA